MDFNTKHYLVLLLFILCQYFCQAGFAGGFGIAGVAMLVGGGMKWGRCIFMECCKDKWTKPENKSKDVIIDMFREKLFGQHLVMQVVPHAIYNHIFDDNPQKALVMSFHGWTGCGKSFVAKLISEYIYRQGHDSEYIHTKIAPDHYPLKGNVEEYKKELREFVRSKTEACGRSLFIFDEMDKMPAGVTDVLKSFIDYHPHVDNVDYRKNIFIFLNNVGGDQISKVTLQNFQDGNAREAISTSVMENILSLSSLKFHGGFQSSELILSGLVDFFVPFLPMERLHVKQCASVEIKRHLQDNDKPIDRDAQKEIVDKVTEEIQFFPKGENIFSKSGCKQVSKKVDMYL